MRDSIIVFSLRRDKKFWIICILIFYIFYSSISTKPCIDTWSSSSSLLKEEYSSEYDQYKYAVLIASDPFNYERRGSIRKSWMKLATNIERDIKKSWGNEKPVLMFLFVVGTGGLRRNDKRLLHTEREMHQDMLILDDFIDSYKALTPKMLISLKWISNQMKNLKYLIKCDDDSFLRIDLIVQNLDAYAPAMDGPEIRKFINHRELPHYKGLYWGYFNGKAKVYKSGKWEEKNWFLCDRYLPYALGGAYVISRNIVDFIAKNADDFSLYNSEDVSMGVWTASLDGINRVHDLRFDTSATSRGCANYMLVRHKVSSSAMSVIYDMLEYSDGKQFCAEEGIDNFYFYNWTSMPSLCCKLVTSN